MSRGQTPRTPEHFPRMKHRAFGRLIYSTGGGYYCGQHGIHWTWGKVTKAGYLEILNDIEDHEIAEHDDYAHNDDGTDRDYWRDLDA